MGYIYKLKLLNGPLSGREIQLREGTLTFGLQDADIILPLEGKQKLISLVVKSESIQVEPKLDGWMGDTWVSLIDDIPIGQPLALLGVAMVIGRSGDDLSQFTDWQIPSKSEGEPVWYFWPAVMLFCVLAISGASIYWLINPPLMSESFRPLNMRDWIVDYTKQHQLTKEISFLWLSDGSLEINGWCQHENDIKSLIAKLRQQQISFHNNIVCEDRLISNVTYSIQLYGYERIKVEAGEHHGEVIINGAIQDDSRWQQVERLLSTMPGLKNWKVLNQSDSEVALLIKELRTSHLLGQLSIRRANGRIVVSGKLNDEQVNRLSEALRKYMVKNPAAGAVTFQNIQAIGADNGVLPAPIVSVGGNQKSPYLELSNGMRLQKGAELPSGYVVRNIDTENGVELSLHGQLVHIPLGF